MDPNTLMLVMLAIMLVGFMFVSNRARKRQTEERARLEESLQVGVNVRTHGGFYGLIVDIDGDTVTLESPGGAETLWFKGAIQGISEPPFASTLTEPADDQITAAGELPAAETTGDGLEGPSPVERREDQ